MTIIITAAGILALATITLAAMRHSQRPVARPRLDITIHLRSHCAHTRLDAVDAAWDDVQDVLRHPDVVDVDDPDQEQFDAAFDALTRHLPDLGDPR